MKNIKSLYPSIQPHNSINPSREQRQLTINELILPPIIEEAAHFKSGLVIVSGLTGAGKTTTANAILEVINNTKSPNPKTILTLEDPIEHVHENKEANFIYKELGQDFESFSEALEKATSHHPNVIFIGEMRDKQTALLALSLAETGYLVITTFHARSSEEIIDRYVKVSPQSHREAILDRLADTLRFTVTQQLIPKEEGKGYSPATEIMTVNDEISENIRTDNLQAIRNGLDTREWPDCISLSDSLSFLVHQSA